MKAQFILGLLVSFGLSWLCTADLMKHFSDFFYWFDTDKDMETLIWVVKWFTPAILIYLFLLADFQKKPSHTVKVRINDANRVRI